MALTVSFSSLPVNMLTTAAEEIDNTEEVFAVVAEESGETDIVQEEDTLLEEIAWDEAVDQVSAGEFIADESAADEFVTDEVITGEPSASDGLIEDTDAISFEENFTEESIELTEDDKVTVNLDPNGGHWADNSTDLKVWSHFELWSEDPNIFECYDDEYGCTRDGYSLAGWATDPEGNEPISDEDFLVHITKDLEGKTLYAIWARIITVQFNFNGGFAIDDEEEKSEICFREAAIGIESTFYFWEYQGPTDSSVVGYWLDESTGVKYYTKDDGVLVDAPYEGMILKAQWVQTVTITHHLNNDDAYFRGYEYEERTLNKKVPAGTPFCFDTDVTFKDDAAGQWRFRGWSFNQDGSGYVYNDEDQETFTESADIYAVFERYYNITIHLNGGSVWAGMAGSDFSIARRQITEGDTFYVHTDDFRAPENCVLLGLTSIDGSDVVEYPVDKPITVNSDMELYAIWSEPKETYTITWHTGEGKFVVTDYETNETTERTEYSIEKLEGSTVVLNAWDWTSDEIRPVRDGYILAEWTDNAGKKYDLDHHFTDNLTENLDFYAVWAKEVNIIWDANDGYFDNGDTKPEQMVEKAPEGYHLERFVGSTPSSKEEGKTFAYWAYDKEGTQRLTWSDDNSFVLSAVAKEGLTFYAIYTQSVTITFDLNGGYRPMDYKNYDPVVCTIPLNYVVRGDRVAEVGHDEDLILVGWSISADSDEIYLGRDDGKTAEKTMDGMTLFAVWKEKAVVTFEFNGGHYKDINPGEGPSSMIRTVGNGSPAIFSFDFLVHPEGKVLSGWKDNADGVFYPSRMNDCQINIPSPYDGMVLTAQWEDTTSIKIKFHVNLEGARLLNGDGGTEMIKSFAEGASVDLDVNAVCEDEHYRLKGWCENQDGSGRVYRLFGDPFAVTKDTDLYGVWEKGYTIKMIANGGLFPWSDSATVNEDSQFIPEGQTFYLPNGMKSTNERMIHLGWSEDPSAENPEYGPFAELSATKDMTFYAIWDMDGVLITWHGNGGTVNSSGEWIQNVTTAVSKGKTLNDSPYVAKQIDDASKTFKWWSKEPDGDGFDTSTPVNEDLDLYAVWAEAAWVTFDANGGEIKFSGESVEKFKHLKNTYIVDPTFAQKVNDTFKGWTTKKDDPSTLVRLDGTDNKVENMYFLKGDVTLYALWNSTIVKAQQEKAAKEAAAKKAAAQKAFSLNVASNASVPLQMKKTSKKVEVKTIAAGDKLKSAVSANKKVAEASVSGSKVVLKGGSSAGTAEISVTTQMGATLKFKVKVQKKPVALKGINVAKKKLKLVAGKKFELAGVTNPITAGEKVKYKTSDKKIAAVNSKGVVTAKKKGTAVITVTAGKKKVEVKVTVKAK